jgi:hypothetical protein
VHKWDKCFTIHEFDLIIESISLLIRLNEMWHINL